MANAMYTTAKEKFMNGQINLTGDVIKVVLIDDADYTYSASHSTLADVPAAARVGTSPALASKTTANAVFDADDTTIPNVTGDIFEVCILYVEGGSDATSHLICYYDNFPALQPNGGNVDIRFSDTTAKIIQF